MNEPRIMIALHSSRGQTEKIGQYIADRLRARGASVAVCPVEAAPSPVGYDVVVLGDSIHLAHHSRELVGYLHRYSAVLEGIPTALFQVSITSADSDAEHATKARTMVRQLLEETGLAPDAVAMFAGALAYTSYGWATRRLIRGVAQKNRLATDTTRDHEYTDWHAVDRFVEDVQALAVPAETEPLPR